MRVCDRQALVEFLKNRLEDDDRLDFLFHLDTCVSCWEEVYNATKSTHPHYYKKPPKVSQVLERELRKLDRAKREEDITEVA